MSKLENTKKDLKVTLKIVKEKLNGNKDNLTKKEERALKRTAIRIAIATFVVSAVIGIGSFFSKDDSKPLGSGKETTNTESNTGRKVEETETIKNEAGQEINNERGTFVCGLREFKEAEPKTYPQPEFDKVVQNIINQYNEQYNETLNNEDVGFYENRTNILGVDEQNNYFIDVENIYRTTNTISDGIDNKIENTYMVIDRRNDEVIASLGKVNGEYVDIDTRNIKTFSGKEYNGSDKTVKLTNLKDKKQLDEIYSKLKDQVEKADEGR